SYNLFCQSCARKTIYKFRNVECVTAIDMCENTTCSIINWNRAIAELDFYVVRPLHNISVHLELLKKDYANQYKPFLVNSRFNLCDVILKRNFLVYGTIVWKTMQRFSNINHSCPLTGHIYARNMYFDESYIPNLPFGIYKMVFNFAENTFDQVQEVGVISLYLEAMEEHQTKKK
ncbi:hypothetical protein KR093_000686, partial [Drosophila rubida]